MLDEYYYDDENVVVAVVMMSSRMIRFGWTHLHYWIDSMDDEAEIPAMASRPEVEWIVWSVKSMV